MNALMRKIKPLMMLIGIGVVGYISILVFLFFLYSGPPDWIRLNISDSGKLLFNGVISAVFFLQHSGMIRRSFRERLTAFIPSHYQGATYTLVSGIVLLGVVAFWQRSDTVLFEAQGLSRDMLRILFVLSILGTGWGMLALGKIDMFGLSAIAKHVHAIPFQESRFTVRGPYHWVRHPLYLFMIVLFWSCPVMTIDRLFFNLAWTLWVVGATLLEERDLTADFGDAYRDYQAKVPMLLPRRLRPFYPNR